MAFVKIVGEVRESSPYLKSGKTYEVVKTSDDGGLVEIVDDVGDLIMILTENSSFTCAHLGRKATAVFV